MRGRIESFLLLRRFVQNDARDAADFVAVAGEDDAVDHKAVRLYALAEKLGRINGHAHSLGGRPRLTFPHPPKTHHLRSR